ncbi:hypothetical protein M422DRAFT_44013 [Sphaerobolus stellatus SS14]|nr:hypothetical protein M422DRAFT_44013 [Sphaerobolus stellatus SS14]
MLIPLTLTPPPTRLPPPLPPTLAKLGSDEIVLIELQGSLEVPQDGTKKDGGNIGVFRVVNDKPTLTIGYHLLEGKLVSLSKPLAVLYKTNHDDDPDGAAGWSMDVDESNRNGAPKSNGETSYDVVAIIKRKVVFSKRPTPIVLKAK